ncbi:MAG: hypothetical protein ACI9DJ_000480 [Algoriphagus sp.]|jgi:hypothetical protein
MIKSLFFLLVVFSANAQNLAPDIANYDIAVSLNTKDKIILGEEKLTWTNTSSVSVNELQFHLYLNAFRDKESTFMKESGGKLRGEKFDEKNFGKIDISMLRSNRGEDLRKSMVFIQPDDNNKSDQTVISVSLKRVLKPGETIILEIGFRAKLPKIFARTGYGPDDYYLIGQWFPKIGVFEKNERGSWAWNCHQFHANSEFYADFGKYKVSITLPQNLILGATGKMVSETKLKNNFKKVVYEVDDVHDFAWTASPKFMVFEKQWKHVKLTALMQPEHASQHKRYFDATEKSLSYFENLLGSYPYPTFTLVDPPIEASGSGGMEYPTFVTCGSYFGVGNWLKIAEIVAVHEFGHQYFQGMLASNEFEQAFLDEGFNQYLENRIMDESYGKGSNIDLFGFQIGDKESTRFSYVTMDYPELSEINKPTWKYPKGVYGDLTYTKTATALSTLENLVGRKKMDAVFRAYFREWQFKHPRFSDFTNTANSVLGKNYNWFFTQAFDKTYSCDYKVDTLRNTAGRGYFTLSREGKFVIPTDVLVSFEDGSSELFIWDAASPLEKFDYPKDIKSVYADPQKKNLMDLNLLNNSYTLKSNDGFLWKYTVKAMFWMQHMISTFLFWIG